MMLSQRTIVTHSVAALVLLSFQTTFASEKTQSRIAAAYKRAKPEVKPEVKPEAKPVMVAVRSVYHGEFIRRAAKESTLTNLKQRWEVFKTSKAETMLDYYEHSEEGKKYVQQVADALCLEQEGTAKKAKKWLGAARKGFWGSLKDVQVIEGPCWTFMSKVEKLQKLEVDRSGYPNLIFEDFRCR